MRKIDRELSVKADRYWHWEEWRCRGRHRFTQHTSDYEYLICDKCYRMIPISALLGAPIEKQSKRSGPGTRVRVPSVLPTTMRNVELRREHDVVVR